MITDISSRISRIKQYVLEIRFRSDYVSFVQDGNLSSYRTKSNYQFYLFDKEYSKSDKTFLYCHLGQNSFLRNSNDYYYQYVLTSSKTIRKIANSKSHNSKFSLPLPIEWIRFFKNNGYNISTFRSTILHIFLGLRIISMNFLKISFLFLPSKNRLGMKNGKVSNLTYVFDMSVGSLAKRSEEIKKFTFSNWLFENTVIDCIYTSVLLGEDERIKYQSFPFELSNKLNYIKNLFKCIFILIKLFSKSAKLFFPSIINFYDLFLLICSNDKKCKLKFKYYIFTNSRGEFRPIWTLDRKYHGEKSITIPYSASEYLRSPFDSNLINHFHKNVQNVESDLFQHAYVKKIRSQGSPLYSPFYIDSNVEMAPPTSKCFSVFDYEAPLGHFGNNSLNEFGYSNIEVVISFLADILEVCKSYNLKVIHKTKRNNVTLRQSDYSRYLRYLDSLDTSLYQRFESSISPIKLIKSSVGTISLPISAPGFIAEDLG